MGEMGSIEVADLFGPDNDEFNSTPATSPWKPPSLSVETAKFPSRDHFQRASFPRNPPLRTVPPILNGGPAVPDMAYDFFSGGSIEKAAPTTRIAFFELGLAGHADASLQEDPHQKGPLLQQRRFRPAVLRERGGDLNAGFDTFVEKKEDGEAVFGHLLAAVRKSRISLHNIHFVTFRNNLNKMMGCCYDRGAEWEMGVHRRGPTVYLHVHHLPERPRSQQDRRMAYYGYAFERLATESRTAEEATGEVNANAEFCVLFKTKMGDTRILMAAELDCSERDSEGRRTYVELKATKELRSERDVATFERFKLHKFWIQSFLAGVPKIVCAFRDNGGRVQRSEAMSLKDITDRVKPNNYWQGGASLAFTDRVLAWLYKSTGEGDADCLLRFAPKGGQLELFRAPSPPLALQEHCQLLAESGG